MVLAKSKNAVGLGNSLMNDRFKSGNSNMHKSSASKQAEITRKDQFGNSYITPGKKEAEWTKLRSVTEQDSLNEFLSTAELAGTDFTAEKMNNIRIIHRDQKNPYLLSRDEERGVMRKQNAKRARLTVPRRPAWDERTSKDELDHRERESLLEWRRGLAELQENDDLLMTPFERNLEVWRQLWRVIERCDLVVQIVDARNPLLFRCEDLERYVKEVDKRKRNLLLVNKADMMTEKQRKVWAEYFVEKGINFRFFSAELAREMNEARYEDEGSGEEEDVVHADDVEEEIDADDTVMAKEAAKVELQDQQEEDEQWVDEETLEDEDDEPPELDGVPISLEEQTRILTTDDLEALFLKHSPASPPSDPDSDEPQRKTQIGLVGYPNVGKSSTINALLGAKRVSVSATPGKTKHFQTIHLSERVILCDCPGLVFPNFASTKAELVCNGVLPIDQLREYTGPAALVAQRIPQAFIEAVYGLRILTRPVDEGGTGIPTGEEVLRALARARGYWTQGVGAPDESRAARLLLKDYVKGKLLFVHPPSEQTTNAKEFNRELYDLAHLPQKRRAQLAASVEAALNESTHPSLTDDPDMVPLPLVQGAKGKNLDTQFFAPGQGNGRVVQPFHYKYSEQGKHLSGRKLKTMTALEQDIDPAAARAVSKKHHKGNKRAAKQTKPAVAQGDYD
ncbi:ribosome biogenesis GTPase-like protein Lsg1 [Neohortaea acidophila]|uniref:Ribosome biogenesis GTPase-like protein Lsg1 n=1 Tax=Neohortaea acidophila TaxID=245834 RepID=A0A6A6PX49_9PEZI|nr:ribosome biogenesis GTPase-like protein Lsg1 [Neohortaea acidophila]KAF2484595.1 ribosome biogenesis GTPase-like protein Lsg1 [Neohortaea acidophila]